MRALFVASTYTLLCPGIAQAQTVPCTTAPPTPANASASVTTAGNASNPAIVTVQWTAVSATGANAVTTYRIEVGNAPGMTNIAALDTGSTALSSTQAAANGTYYVRVRAVNACGTSGPSPEPTVTVAGAIAAGQPAAGIVIRNSAIGEVVGGGTYAVGEVRGAWGARATSFIKVTATFIGSTGQVVGTDFSYVLGRTRRVTDTRAVDDTSLAAGESGCFIIFSNTPAASVAGARVNASWDLNQLEVLRGNVLLYSYQQEPGSLGELRSSGQLRNAGTTVTFFTHVHQDVRGPQDRVIDCDYALVDGIPVQLSTGETTNTGMLPGQIAPFVNLFSVNFSDVARAAITPAWVENDTGATTPTSRPRSWRTLIDPNVDLPERDRKGRAHLRNAAIDRLRQLTDSQ